MKFKTLFQRRPTTSMAESGPTSVGTGTTTKRKKKDGKPLTTTMKSVVGTKNAFVSLSCQEKCSSCSTEAADQTNETTTTKQRQPQPDEFANSIRFSCENCGGRENQMISTLNSDEGTVKLADSSPVKVEIMDLEKAKQEIEEYKELLSKAHTRIKELTDEVNQLKSENLEKDKEFEKLHDDFLLCIRGAERFRFEAEVKAADLESEVADLQQKLSTLSGHDIGDCAVSSLPEVAAASVNAQKSCDNFEAMEEKNQSRALMEDALNPEKDDVKNEKETTRRDEKLGALRKNCRGSVRNGLLKWCQAQTQAYKNIEITNFSTCWSNGLALAALIHSLNPEEFDYDALNPRCPVDNFETALKAAVKLGVTSRLNAIKLIVESENPPWEPIIAYVTEVYLAVSK